MHLLGGSIKNGATVDVFAIVLRHRLRPGLGRENAVVAVVLELRQEEVVELVRLDLLQADDVRGVMAYLVEDALLPVLPVQRPARTVSVHLSRRVFVAQYVVAHHRKDACETNRTSTPCIIIALQFGGGEVFSFGRL